MTCVVSTPWHSFNSTYGWSPMNLEDISTPTSAAERTQYGYISSESESRHHSSGSSKKRASRAGTRSVSTLSAAQLERKRANDREAQRAIRQRTKDHIEHLERNISDLRGAHDASEETAAVARQRNRELEQENSYLRTKLGELGYAVPAPASDHQRAPEQHLLAVHSTSPSAQVVGASIPRSESTSTASRTLSVNTSQSSGSRHGSWQQGATHFAVTGASATPSLPAHSAVQLGPSLTSWRSHESANSVHSNPGGIQEQHSLQPQAPYLNNNPNDRAQWSVAPAYPYQDPQRTPSQPHTSPQPQPQFAQNPGTGYAPTSTPQPRTYVAPPQSEFQGMSVQSPVDYQVQQQQQPSYQQPHYQMAPVQVAPPATEAEYVQQISQLHPPQIVPAAYAHPQAEQQQYAPQQVPQPLQYQADPNNRGYSLTHYPTG